MNLTLKVKKIFFYESNLDIDSNIKTKDSNVNFEVDKTLFIGLLGTQSGINHVYSHLEYVKKGTCELGSGMT